MSSKLHFLFLLCASVIAFFPCQLLGQVQEEELNSVKPKSFSKKQEPDRSKYLILRPADDPSPTVQDATYSEAIVPSKPNFRIAPAGHHILLTQTAEAMAADPMTADPMQTDPEEIWGEPLDGAFQEVAMVPSRQRRGYQARQFDPSYGPMQFGPRIYINKQPIWFQGDYLMYWNKGADVPVLASTGRLGQTGTNTLFGGDIVDMSMHSGTRWTMGMWQSEIRDIGIEASYSFLANRGVRFSTDTQAFPTLAQPFLNSTTGLEDAAFIGVVGAQTGSLLIDISNQTQMADALVRMNLTNAPSERLDFLIGYRYGKMNEGLGIDASALTTSPLGAQKVGTVITSSDLFQVYNTFHGGELGLSSNSSFGRWGLGLSTKLGIGSNRSHVRVDGTTATSVPGLAVVNSPGGIYALPTNMGIYQRDYFALIPEVGTSLTYRVTRNCDLSLGYSFIYWSKLVRPGQLVDRSINPSQISPGPLVGTPAPNFAFKATDFWVQGIQLGLQFRF